VRKPEGERWDLIIDGEDLIAMSADLDFKFLDFVFFGDCCVAFILKG
jgi:hypothetical protein